MASSAFAVAAPLVLGRSAMAPFSQSIHHSSLALPFGQVNGCNRNRTLPAVCSHARMDVGAVNRREFVRVMIGSAAFLLPLAAARPASAVLATKAEASAEARAARTAFGGLALYVAERRYEDLRTALRAGSLSRIRSACKSLTQYATDETAAQDVYRRLIAGVEKVDLLALKASRGDETAAAQAMGTLDDTVDIFDAFLRLIPGLQDVELKPTVSNSVSAN